MGHRFQWELPKVNTACDIAAKQNDEQQVNLLAAASRVYGQAKHVMAFQFALTVPAALVSSILMAWQPSWKVWLTFYSITVALVDTIYLSRKQARLKKRGATLQQMFDCAVLELPWRPLRCGPPIDSEDVYIEAKAHLSKPEARKYLLDWYPTAVGQLPLRFARLVCQRASVSWDFRLRARVRGALTITLSALSAVVFLIALARGDTVEQMILTVYVPLAPAILWILREMLAQHDAVEADKKALAHVEQLWPQALAGTLSEASLLEQSIQGQDALFEARSRSPFVFDWVYHLLRKGQQEQMEHKAEELVKEAMTALNASNSRTQESDI